MKESRKMNGSLLKIAHLTLAAIILHVSNGFAQAVSDLSVSAPDSIVQVTADAYGLSPVPADQVPPFGTFWLASPGGFNGLLAAPLPCPPDDPNLPIFQIAEGQYLVDGTGGQTFAPAFAARRSLTSDAVSAAASLQSGQIADLIANIQSAQVMSDLKASVSMSAMSADGLSPTDSSGSGGFSPADAQFAAVNYGTNLWIAQTAISSAYLTAIGSNTIPSVGYTIQSRTNLAQADWQTEGIIYGAELTNWTPLSVVRNSRTNLFLRLRSEFSSDNSGLPDWWQKLYFGTNGVDPNGNPAGDGWSNLQKYQIGWNPNQFYAPAAPQGVTTSYDAQNSTVTISWLPAAGMVTNYTVMDNSGNSVNVSRNSDSATFSVQPLSQLDLEIGGPNVGQAYRVQANYAQGASAASDWVGLGGYAPHIAITLVPGANGSVYLAVAPSTLPPSTTAIRLSRIDQLANYSNISAMVTNFDIPLSSFTNGLYLIPTAWQSLPVDNQQSAYYTWWGGSLNKNGSPNSYFKSLSYGYNLTKTNGWLDMPFFDGRIQLKQNLAFQLRAAVMDSPFFMQEFYDAGIVSTAYPYEYAYAGFYDFSDLNNGAYNPFLPFQDNYKYRNFVFSLSDLRPDGSLRGLTNYDVGGSHGLIEPQRYYFQCPATNGATIAPLLDNNTARWLDTGLNFYNYYSPGLPPLENYSEIAMQVAGYYPEAPKTMTANSSNWFGLPFVSTKVAWGNSLSQTTTLVPGNTTTNDFFLYTEVGQPGFKTIEYDFWSPTNAILPGDANFQATNSSPWFLSGVGTSVSVVGYAKLEVTNSCYTGVYGYLGQYFDTAYKVDGNGNVTPNATGIVSPYGNFFATEPGLAALVTKADIDTGERGTCIVYSVSCVIDRTQGSNMDLTFNGANATSVNDPAVVWCNNNYDRWHDVDCTFGFNCDSEQDDLGRTEVAKLPAEQVWPDCQYTISGFPAIPSTRDLEDYFRLWLPGLAAAMKAMPTDYTVRLTLAGDGQIRIFHAIEPDGGTNYLFDGVTASSQVYNSLSLYAGLLTSNSPVYFQTQTNFNEHFIFCGAHTGSAQVDLQILDGSFNVVADAPAFLQVKDIKQMYERWSVGENPSRTPAVVAINSDGDFDKDSLMPKFSYPNPTDTNTAYILFVHGWNMETWEKDRFAEAAYKRLYWQGYKGRFGSFRWPTYNGFGALEANNPISDSKNFDNSESNAWASATGLLNKLNDLNAVYPGHVYLMAHSMGNIVAGEALRLAGTNQVVNTYVAMQAAVASHAYDPTTPTRSLGLQDSSTPNCYAHYWTVNAPCYFASSAGAGTYVNFFNANDWALNSGHWQLDQNLKPDTSFAPYIPNFYFSRGDGTRLDFPTNTYEIFAYCDEARCYALGTQSGVGGVFGGNQVSLPNVWPPDLDGYIAHKWHSAEFRSDNMQRALFWNALLTKMKLK